MRGVQFTGIIEFYRQNKTNNYFTGKSLTGRIRTGFILPVKFFYRQNKHVHILKHVHMRGKINSYRFEISNQRENKFCSHEVSFRLHFKKTQYFDGHVQIFHFGQCLHDILSLEMKFHFCQNDRYEIHTRIEFQRHMCIKYNTQRVCAYSFHFG